MNDTLSLSHSRWECKYHVVLDSKVPEKATIWPTLRRYLGPSYKGFGTQ